MVGGGIAGVSAAVVLAERGVAVTLLEAAPTLGGRLGAWPHTLPDGTEQVVEHGFHAFFRHYYTWRDILRRIDPRWGSCARSAATRCSRAPGRPRTSPGCPPRRR